MKDFTKIFNRVKNFLSSPRLTQTILFLIVVVLLFNFNIDAFRAGAQSSPVTGTGQPGYIPKWIPMGGTLSIQPNSANIQVGQNATFTVIYNPGSGPVDVTSLATWSPADTADCSTASNAVVTKVGNGVYSGVAVGNACVQVSYLSLNSTASISVTNAVTVTLTASPVTSGGSTTLTWSTTGNPTSCTASGGWSGSKSTSGGSQTINNLTSSTSFTLICDGVSQQVNVTVNSSNFSITVNKTVGGSVTSNDGNINCGTTCSANYTSGSSVTLTAHPNNSDWKFVGWTGDCTGSGVCSLTVSGNKSVNAIFTPMPSVYQEF
jgi:hypothetical protein